MKKLILLLLPGIFAFTSAKAAGDNGDETITKTTQQTGEKCYDENSHILNLGVGFGGTRYYSTRYGSGYGRTPVMSLSYEQPWHQRLGPGFLGVGAYAAYQHADYRYNDPYNDYYYEHDWNYLSLMARATYHWDVLNSARAEVYAGVLIGVRMQFYDYHSSYPGALDTYREHENVAYPAYGVFAGARWYFVKNVAVFAEAGVGYANITGGLSFKF